MNDQSDQSGREYEQNMENLRIELKEAHIYYRESLSMIFRVALAGMFVFAGEITFFATCAGHKELSYLTLQIPGFGMLTALGSIAAQFISLEMHRITRDYYLRPLKQSLNLPSGPVNMERRRKNTVERITVVLLLLLNMVYFAVWVVILF